jgi:hypothetical protein
MPQLVPGVLAVDWMAGGVVALAIAKKQYVRSIHRT